MLDYEVLQASFAKLEGAPCFEMVEGGVERCVEDCRVVSDDFDAGILREGLFVDEEVECGLPLGGIDVTELRKFL